MFRNLYPIFAVFCCLFFLYSCLVADDSGLTQRICQDDNDCARNQHCYEGYCQGRTDSYEDNDTADETKTDIAPDETDEDNTEEIAPNCEDQDQDNYPGTGSDCDRESDNFDCDDTNDAIHPGAEEICDGVDNNCDQRLDIGLILPCYTGPDGTLSVGICAQGQRTCVRGEWGECLNEIVPEPEDNGVRCDSLDNDCDDDIDEGCACLFVASDPPTRPCYSAPENTENIGTCLGGTQTCQSDYTWGACIGEIVPEDETCANQHEDNDCDNELDNIHRLNELCDTGLPSICASGNNLCVGNNLECVGQILPDTQEETCLNPESDNNCDGLVDNVPGLEESCRSELVLGACQNGLRLCAQGELTCFTPEPQPETCNRIDDDCNGDIDDLPPCFPDNESLIGIGICRAGTQDCLNGRPMPCEGAVYPSEEVCDGQDNDCDSLTDEDDNGDLLQESCYTYDPDTENIGICQSGLTQCVEGSWSDCQGEIGPEDELCDSRDNDCDGEIDEGFQLAGDCLSEESLCGPGTIECGPNLGDVQCSSEMGGSEFEGRIISCGETDSWDTGDNNLYDRKQTYTCEPNWDYTGTEAIYGFFSERNQTVTVTLSELLHDMDLFRIPEGCDTICVQSSANGGNQTETIEFIALAHTTHYFVVDEPSNHSSTFTLGVTCEDN